MQYFLFLIASSLLNISLFAQANKNYTDKPQSVSEENRNIESHKGHLKLPVDNCISIDTGNFKTGMGSSVTIPQLCIKNSIVKAIFPCQVESITEFDMGSDKRFMLLCKQGSYAITLDNLKSVKVQKGEKLKEGDIIGVVGDEDQSQLQFTFSCFSKNDLNALQWFDLRSKKIRNTIQL